MEIVLVPGLWLFGSLVMAITGMDRNIGFWGALIISLVVSPAIGAIVVALSKSKEREKLEREALKRIAGGQHFSTAEFETGKLLSK